MFDSIQSLMANKTGINIYT